MNHFVSVSPAPFPYSEIACCMNYVATKFCKIKEITRSTGTLKINEMRMLVTLTNWN